MKTAMFERFEIELPDACVAECSHQGDCLDDVKRWVPCLALNHIDPDKIRDELRDCGAWDDEELADNEANLRRIVWLAACNIREEDYERERSGQTRRDS